MTAAINSRSMRTWRKFHRFSFGYFKIIGLVTAFIMIVISLTGILLTHQDDLRIIQNSRLSSSVLPDEYQERLDETRKRQQLDEIIPRETSVPLKWVILDLHTGDFWGSWGRWYYDLIAVAFMSLAFTGFYMYWKIRKNHKF
ncbi:MAG: PepSY domain-containing protein [Candidatus Marinimicrobia bacterium]|nr:PepSY domain-containing protein [Candidatus Neomarinimicrobiota bacterium]MCF7839671.1 PepSY domain-containing protein [Candidatus Neomarinimicrobiota bacterium]MCF7903273.1 PepSY domain-containing protein [Candidatus Neomarinimicrobiota bacterium]